MKDEAISHYEAALKEAFPTGATGDVFHHWNEARKALAQPEPVSITITGKLGNVYSFTGDYGLKKGDKVYLSPPKREWQGLTDDERNDCLVEADPCECLATPEAEELMRCIEAKLKEKNT